MTQKLVFRIPNPVDPVNDTLSYSLVWLALLAGVVLVVLDTLTRHSQTQGITPARGELQTAANRNKVTTLWTQFQHQLDRWNIDPPNERDMPWLTATPTTN
jgi:hypothetical protein